jgi:ADP-ribosylglycohydrolase
MIIGSFAGDSLALGVHWVYNTRAIDKKAGRVEDLIAPIVETFHTNKSAGEFTHYGDQQLLLLRFLAENREIGPEAYFKEWADTMKNYTGYMDHATEDTLTNFKRIKDPLSSGSGSDDFAGAVRAIPLVYRYAQDLDTLLSYVENFVKVTYNNDIVVETARFLTLLLTDVLQGTPPAKSVGNSLDRGGWSEEITGLVRKGLESAGGGTRETIKEFGQACPAAHALPGVIHIIASYEKDVENGLIENIMAGGDSAARGLAAGAVLGAYNGLEAIPARWRSGLSAGKEIENLLDRIDSY